MKEGVAVSVIVVGSGVVEESLVITGEAEMLEMGTVPFFKDK